MSHFSPVSPIYRTVLPALLRTSPSGSPLGGKHGSVDTGAIYTFCCPNLYASHLYAWAQTSVRRLESVGLVDSVLCSRRVASSLKCLWRGFGSGNRTYRWRQRALRKGAAAKDDPSPVPAPARPMSGLAL